jgi:GxxExxY protein
MSNELTHIIIGAAIEVHKQLGPGLLESIYEEALFYEMQSNGLKVVQQKSFPIIYKGNLLSTKYRCDLLVNVRLLLN